MKLKDILRGSLPLLKTAAIVLAFEVVLSLFSLIILGIIEEKFVLSVFMIILFIGCMLMFFAVISSCAAYTAFELKKNNALRMKNGEEVPSYKQVAAFRPWYGYISGFLSALPLIVMIILTGCGLERVYIAIKVAFVPYFLPFYAIRFGMGLGEAAVNVSVWLLLIGAAVQIITVGVAYHIRGIRMQRRLDAILARQSKKS
ncbi:MAG: hypothetical protein IJF71_01260 [Clostridia bacterium]|nr:hypothetical protein [Clostridia bacterium]